MGFALEFRVGLAVGSGLGFGSGRPSAPISAAQTKLPTKGPQEASLTLGKNSAMWCLPLLASVSSRALSAVLSISLARLRCSQVPPSMMPPAAGSVKGSRQGWARPSP